MDNHENQNICLAHSGSLTEHLKRLNMLAKSVFNDFQNNLIINKSTSKHGKCTLNTLRMIVWFETKWKKV